MTMTLKLAGAALSLALLSSLALGQDNAGSGARTDTSGTIEPKLSTNDFAAVVPIGFSLGPFSTELAETT